MHKFTDQIELIGFAEDIIKKRIDSLKKDVDHCLLGDAAFPALLYCFSTIDLLGAFYGGNASGNTTKQSADYMQSVMNYSKKQSDLLQKLFRHKIVHLAQPTVINYDGRRIGWRYFHDWHPQHLILVKCQKGSTVLVTSSWASQIDSVFIISISQLVEDIQDSVERPDGYMASLRNLSPLQNNFERAIEQIYDPPK